MATVSGVPQLMHAQKNNHYDNFSRGECESRAEREENKLLQSSECVAVYGPDLSLSKRLSTSTAGTTSANTVRFIDRHISILLLCAASRKKDVHANRG